MVSYEARLDRTFSALRSPARRAILSRLSSRDRVSVSELANPAGMKLPAMLKHLDVLEHAGLITRSKSGRVVHVRLSSQPMAEATAWLHRYERYWGVRLDQLVAYAEKQERRARRAGR